MLVDVTVTPVFTVFERTWWAGEVSEVWKWENVTPIFKKAKKEDPRNARMNSLTSMPRKVIEKLILENISKRWKTRRWLKVVSMDLQTQNHAIRTWLPIRMQWLARWMACCRAVDFYFSKALLLFPIMFSLTSWWSVE